MKNKDPNPHASALGKLSAKNITEAKRKASRRNGKLGGRPITKK